MRARVEPTLFGKTLEIYKEFTRGPERGSQFASQPEWRRVQLRITLSGRIDALDHSKMRQVACTGCEAKHNLESTLSRARPKELVHDYLEPGSGDKQPTTEEELDNSSEGLQA